MKSYIKFVRLPFDVVFFVQMAFQMQNNFKEEI